MLVANALQAVLTMALIIGVGVAAVRFGYISEDMEVRISKFVLHFCVPCLLFVSCLNYISREMVSDLGVVLLIPLFSISLCYGVAVLVGKLFRVPRENFGLFCIMFSMSNVIFIGMPLSMMIFGEEALPLIAAYFPFNTLLFWTLGAYGMAGDTGEKYKLLSMETLKKIFSPPLLGAIAGVTAALVGITPPTAIIDAMGHIGSVTTPFACILVGCTLCRMGKDVIKVPREGWLAMIGRYMVAPAIVFALGMLMGAPVFVSQVFMTVAVMPVMSQSMLIARVYKGNYQMAAQMIAVTTMLCFIYIPLLMAVIS
ncbi:MAG: AEC family transporter [Lachnospiraceae bacterium]|jgi:predicted permease|nr:AEC family transporter [Lachnospiraceae bacterium]